jgi:hypothetical protein
VLREREEMGVVLFLEHHKRKGMNQEEEGRKKNNKQTKENQEGKSNLVNQGDYMHVCNMMT